MYFSFVSYDLLITAQRVISSSAGPETKVVAKIQKIIDSLHPSPINA